MELGATVCTPQSPSCSTCPIRVSCHAYADSTGTRKKAAATFFGKITAASTKEKSLSEDTHKPCSLCFPPDLKPSGHGELSKVALLGRAAGERYVSVCSVKSQENLPGATRPRVLLE